MWADLEKGFQIAFEKAWEAYKNNTIPIGVAVLDAEGTLMATGQNQIYSEGKGLIKFHQIAHAEINAILHLSEVKDASIKKNIRTYTLYSTMEPCPLCFGAIVMGSIRNLKFAARDNYAGATSINNSLDYAKNKKITVSGPFEEPEIVQIAMQFCHELRRTDKHYSPDILRESWGKVCEKGVNAGIYLHEKNILEEMFSCEFGEIYDLILTRSGD